MNLVGIGNGWVATSPVIPGDLTINGGTTGAAVTVNLQGNSRQIASTSNVTINGRGTLTLAGNVAGATDSNAWNRFNSLTFTNPGGEAAPTVTVPAGSSLLLSSSSPITASSNNAANVATVTGGFLALGTGANTITVNPVQLNGVGYAPLVASLNIGSVITGANTAGTVNVVTSNAASPTVTVTSVPASLVVGSTLLGQTVTAISGTTVTLGGNANKTIGSATDVTYFGSNAASITKAGNGGEHVHRGIDDHGHERRGVVRGEHECHHLGDGRDRVESCAVLEWTSGDGDVDIWRR